MILSYLEYRYPDPPLLPAAAGPRARALWFEEYADTKVGESVAGVFFQRVIRPTAFKQETDEQLVTHLMNSALPKVFDYLAGCLGDDEFMVGGEFSLADIAITSAFVNFALAGETVDSARWPQLARYIQRVHGHPCYAPIADLEGEFAKFKPKDIGNV